MGMQGQVDHLRTGRPGVRIFVRGMVFGCSGMKYGTVRRDQPVVTRGNRVNRYPEVRYGKIWTSS